MVEKVKVSNKQSKRPFVLIAIMLASFMGAVEGTIISTAMPAIAGDLGDFSLYSWVFSSYLLMNTVTVLIYGKLADIFGRKPILSIGIILFLLGSLLCGLASSMPMLIVFRFLQGLGAGAVSPIAMTIVGDMYTKEERGKIQGYLSSVWGISAILGPAIGGFLVEYASWHYVFWINIPIGLVSLILLSVYFQENMESVKRRVDYGGAAILTISVTALMVVLVEGGVSWPWLSFPTIFTLSIFVVGFLLFFLLEKRVEEPIVPFRLWKVRSILVANIVSLTSGIILIGISSYLPTFVQGVMEKSPTIAGFTLTTISIGWPIASTIAGKLMYTVGFRNLSLAGALSLIVGSGLFLLLTPDKGPLWAAVGSFFIGVGMGLTSTSFIVSIQTTVSWEERGIATALNMFMRNLGNTVGVALLGGILNSRLQAYFHSHSELTSEQLTPDSVNRLLDVDGMNELSELVRSMLQSGLTDALHIVYLVVSVFAIISLVAILFFPKDVETKK